MNTTNSTHIISGKLKRPSIEIPNTLILDFIERCHLTSPDLFNNDIIAKETLDILVEKLKANTSPYEPFFKTITYLNTLLTLPDQGALFLLAATLIIQTDQLWCLSHDTLNLLQKIKSSNQITFNTFLSYLKERCNPYEDDIAIKPCHFDMMIHLLESQKQLAPHIVDRFNNFLQDKGAAHFKAVIQARREQHAIDIALQAETNHLAHHNNNHRHEMGERSMHLIRNIFNLFNGKNELESCLRHLIRFYIEYHDYYQTPQSALVAEQITAETIAKWLIDDLDLQASDKEIADFLLFIANYIIVLGTLMIFYNFRTARLSTTPPSTMKLVELFLTIQTAAHETGHDFIDDSNRPFIKSLTLVTICASINDTSPNTCYETVRRQTHEINTNALLNLKHYYQVLLLETFINTPAFIRPFEFEGVLPDTNTQNVLMSLVPKLCMSSELGSKSQTQYALLFNQLIMSCQQQHELKKSDEAFFAFFEARFDELGIDKALINLFFSRIPGEATFCLSQIKSITFFEQWLIAAGFLDESGKLPSTPLTSHLTTTLSQRFIDPSILEKEATNLLTFERFFSLLDSETQRLFLKELALLVIRQAGACYQERAGITEESVPSTPQHLGICTTPRGRSSPLDRYKNRSDIIRQSLLSLDSASSGVSPKSSDPNEDDVTDRTNHTFSLQYPKHNKADSAPLKFFDHDAAPSEAVTNMPLSSDALDNLLTSEFT